MAETVTLSYDGAGTLIATIFNTVPGDFYRMDNWGHGASNVNDVATGTTLTLEIDDAALTNNAGEQFLVYVWKEPAGLPIHDYILTACHFTAGTPSSGESNPPDMNATYDHVTGDFTITLTPRGVDTDPFGAWCGNGDGYDAGGTLSTITFNLGDISGCDFELIDLQLNSHAGGSGWWDDAAQWWVIPGSDTVYTFTAGSAPIVANFTGSPLRITTGSSVSFTDTSSPAEGETLNSWSWDFGDGGTSTSQNPSHVYSVAGTYTVTLTVTDTGSNTDVITRTNYITVFVPAINIDCAHAAALSPGGGTILIDNSDAPDTPLIDDPFNDPAGYDWNWQFSRQKWYKLTNTDIKDRFALFTLQNPSTTSGYWFVAGLYFGTCGSLQPPWDTQYDDVGQAEYSYPPVDWPSYPFFPAHAYPQIYTGILNDFQARVGFNYNINYLGVKLKPGQTVYIEIAGDDNETGPTAPGITQINLTWELLAVTQYDAIDRNRPSDTIRPGLSEVYPSGTELDISGFDTTDVGFGAGLVEVPKTYVHHDNYHFIAARASKEVAKPPSYGSGNADWHQDQIGVWQLDSDGNQVAFHILDTHVGVGGVSLIGNATAGERIFGDKYFLLSDGTNLWCVVKAREIVPNPYDGTGHDWSVSCLAVYSWSGGTWSRIGATTSQTTNEDFFPSLAGGFGVYDFIWGAHARDGNLHILYCEEGIQDSDDPHILNLAPNYGTSPRHWRNCFTYAKFSSSAKVDQFNILEEDHPASDGVIEIQNAYSKFLAVRADDSGGAIGIWSPPRTDGTFGYKNTVEIYNISGGSASIIRTLTATDGLPAKPSSWTGADPDRIVPDSWWITFNSDIDIGLDSKDVYFFQVRYGRGSPGPTYDVLYRMPTDDPSGLLYFENNIQTALNGVSLGGSYINSYLRLEQNDIWLANEFNNIYEWSRLCANDPTVDGWINWARGYASGGQYPTMFPNGPTTWLGDDDFFYTAVLYYDPDNPYGYGSGTAYGLGRSKILRDFYICTLYSSPIISIVNVVVDTNGDVKLVSGGCKFIKINTDGTIQYVEPSDIAYITVDTNGQVKRSQ